MPKLRASEDLEADEIREKESEEIIERSMAPLDPNDSFSHIQTGFVAMVPSPDGGPGAVPTGGSPLGPGEGLSGDTLVCNEDPSTGRQQCIYHGALLWPAPGDTKGIAQKPLQLRRFCTKLASQSELMELTDTEVYACTMRSPPDDRSLGLIRNFEKRQRQIAADGKRTSGGFDL